MQADPYTCDWGQIYDEKADSSNLQNWQTFFGRVVGTPKRGIDKCFGRLSCLKAQSQGSGHEIRFVTSTKIHEVRMSELGRLRNYADGASRARSKITSYRSENGRRGCLRHPWVRKKTLFVLVLYTYQDSTQAQKFWDFWLANDDYPWRKEKLISPQGSKKQLLLFGASADLLLRGGEIAKQMHGKTLLLRVAHHNQSPVAVSCISCTYGAFYCASHYVRVFCGRDDACMSRFHG